MREKGKIFKIGDIMDYENWACIFHEDCNSQCAEMARLRSDTAEHLRLHPVLGVHENCGCKTLEEVKAELGIE